jgi:hypothetical protein
MYPTLITKFFESLVEFFTLRRSSLQLGLIDSSVWMREGRVKEEDSEFEIFARIEEKVRALGKASACVYFGMGLWEYIVLSLFSSK